MSVRLESFQYLPVVAEGWETPELRFGRLFTAVQGANGSGKTPVMKGVTMALGHEIELPPDIRTHCRAARLQLSVDGDPITLTRSLSEEFKLRVDDGKEAEEFREWKRFGQWFVELLGGAQRTLTSKRGEAAELYANIVLPAFWVDQDHGWTTAYFTPKNRDFIRDQRQEVIRFLTGLASRHPFRDKTDFDEAKEQAEKAAKDVELQRYVVERLRRDYAIAGEDEEARLVERETALQAELMANRDAIETVRDLSGFYERDLARLEEKRAELASHGNVMRRRRGQLKLVLAELSGEVEILGANVEAAELLRAFCGRDGCEMFLDSEYSYGRSLLYLKDQIKDVEAADQGLEAEASGGQREIEKIAVEIAARRAERASAVEASPHAGLAKKLDELTEEMVDVKFRVASLRHYQSERAKFERSLDRLEQVKARVAELRPRGARGGTDPIEDVRRELTESMRGWLAVLGTENIGEAGFSNDFRLHIDGSEFSATSHQSGSTRTRIVLAFHAALVEVSLKRGGNHPGWLLFDAPKQHELNQDNLDAYVERLRRLAGVYESRLQVVFSVADLKTQLEVTDEVWEPMFRNAEGRPRFLGPTKE